MQKTLLLLSFLSLMFLALGAIFIPNHLIFWFASTSFSYQVLRFALASVLSIQLLTNPPRHIWFRLVAGFVGLGVLLGVTRETYLYQMQLLDALALTSGALAVLVTAIERKADALQKVSNYSGSQNRAAAH